ncbi:hypothetical protein, partial [Klebsiella michiganensis]|uniref:hypothetical protein n=1 Tax=Klebsiella michiganensis TaxID=1134687 RepID=UPI001D0DDA3A
IRDRCRVDLMGYTPWGCIDLVSAGTARAALSRATKPERLASWVARVRRLRRDPGITLFHRG